MNILPRELMIKNKNILGDNFYSYMLDEVEALDVDTEYEFMLAEILYEKMRKQWKTWKSLSSHIDEPTY